MRNVNTNSTSMTRWVHRSLVGVLLLLTNLWLTSCAGKQPPLNMNGFSTPGFQWQVAHNHFRDFLVGQVSAVIPTSNFDAIARLKVRLILGKDDIQKLDPTKTQRTFYVGQKNGKWVFEREQIQPAIAVDGHALTKGDLVMLYFLGDAPFPSGEGMEIEFAK